MKSFQDIYMETRERIIEYNGMQLMSAACLLVKNKFSIELELISTNSDLRQGISFSTKGKIDVGNGLIGPKHIFWEELWTEGHFNGPFVIHGTSKDGIFWIYNSYRWYGYTDACTGNAAMIEEKIGKNEYIYHCNDRVLDYDFDDIVFRVKILEGAREEGEPLK